MTRSLGGLGAAHKAMQWLQSLPQLAPLHEVQIGSCHRQVLAAMPAANRQGHICDTGNTSRLHGCSYSLCCHQAIPIPKMVWQHLAVHVIFVSWLVTGASSGLLWLCCRATTLHVQQHWLLPCSGTDWCVFSPGCASTAANLLKFTLQLLCFVGLMQIALVMHYRQQQVRHWITFQIQVHTVISWMDTFIRLCTYKQRTCCRWHIATIPQPMPFITVVPHSHCDQTQFIMASTVVYNTYSL